MCLFSTFLFPFRRGRGTFSDGLRIRLFSRGEVDVVSFDGFAFGIWTGWTRNMPHICARM